MQGRVNVEMKVRRVGESMWRMVREEGEEERGMGVEGVLNLEERLEVLQRIREWKWGYEEERESLKEAVGVVRGEVAEGGEERSRSRG